MTTTSKIRSLIFWPHLIVGISVGLVIFVLASTGVLLMFERQLLFLDERSFAVSPEEQPSSISADELLAIGKRLSPNDDFFELKFVNVPGAAMTIVADNWDVWLVNPYTGVILREGDGVVANLFYFITDVHRNFSLHGQAEESGKFIISYSNLLFLFLIVRGTFVISVAPFFRRISIQTSVGRQILAILPAIGKDIDG